MGWIIALGILTGLAILPVGIRAVYDQRGPLVLLLIGPVKLTLYPKKKADKATVVREKKSSSAKAPASQKKGGDIREFSPMVETILQLLLDFKRKLRVNNLELKLVLAGDDPCDLALNYGRAWAALGNLMPRLESVFVIKKRNLEVECDFTSNATVILARVDLTITIGRLIRLALRHGFKGLRQYREILNKRKGGVGI